MDGGVLHTGVNKVSIGWTLSPDCGKRHFSTLREPLEGLQVFLRGGQVVRWQCSGSLMLFRPRPSLQAMGNQLNSSSSMLGQIIQSLAVSEVSVRYFGC